MSKKLLLASCCAPCSIGTIQRLKQKGVDFAVVFYNPNIRPQEEYQKRCAENKRVCELFQVPFIELDYEPHLWQEATQGLENEPEKGSRCEKCFRLRLNKVAQYAKENGFESFSSVFGISRYKDFDQVTRVAHEVAQTQQIAYDDTNWRKNAGEEHTNRLSKEYQLYRQNYCGCKPRENKD